MNLFRVVRNVANIKINGTLVDVNNLEIYFILFGNGTISFFTATNATEEWKTSPMGIAKFHRSTNGKE